MQDEALVEPRAFARADTGVQTANSEAAEVARLLMRAGVDQTSSLYFQLLELATQQACDWSERSAAGGAPLSARAAAIVGLRALAGEVLSAATVQAEGAHAAAEACLNACAEIESQALRTPPRQRRWGEGALPQPPKRPGLLEGSVGCC